MAEICTSFSGYTLFKKWTRCNTTVEPNRTGATVEYISGVSIQIQQSQTRIPQVKLTFREHSFSTQNVSKNCDYFVHVRSHTFQRKLAILFFFTFTALSCSRNYNHRVVTHEIFFVNIFPGVSSLFICGNPVDLRRLLKGAISRFPNKNITQMFPNN